MEEVDGIAFLKDGIFVRTPTRQRIKELSELPIPLWKDLGDLDRYHIPFYGRTAIPLITSRGCPGNCTFCYTKVMWGYKWTALSPERMVEEIELVRSIDPSIGAFIINDDLFSLETRRVSRFCTLLKEKGIDILWNCEMRADTVGPDLLREMYDAGCRQVLIGLESGSERMLDLVEKETSIEAMKGAYRAAHDAGIDVCSFVLVGLPGETELDILETEKLLNEVRSDSIDVCVYVPYPGTKLYALAKESGFQEPTDLRGWAELGSVGFSAFEEKGISKVSQAHIAHMIERTIRKARHRRYVQELRREPLSAPLRGWRFVLRKRQKGTKAGLIGQDDTD